MCNRVARVGPRASFDAEQQSRHQTHRRSHSARMPNIRRARARTLSTHPDWRSRGECSAMCGGSIKVTSGLVFGKCSVRISAGTPATPIDVSHSFPECLHANVGKIPQLGNDRFLLDQWYSTVFVRVPPDIISLQLCTPKLLVYNSSYTQSIIYIQNKLNKLHQK
jgi:hypothetical protein